MFKFKRFRNRIFIPFLILNLLFLVTMSIFLYEKMTGLLKTREKKLIESQIYQVGELLDYQLKGALEATSLVYMDKSYVQTLRKLNTSEMGPNNYRFYQELLEKVNGLKFSKDVYNIRFFIESDHDQFQNDSLIITDQVLKEKGFYDVLVENPYAIVWFEDNIQTYSISEKEREVISAGRLISRQNGENIFVFVDILKSDIFKILEQSQLKDEGTFRLLSPQKEIIWEESNYEQSDKMTSDRVALSTSWTIEYVLSPSIYSEMKKETRNLFWVFIPGSVLSFAFVSYYLAKRLTEDLETFSTQMKMKEDGFNVGMLVVEREDEIGDFQRTIQKLLKDIELVNKAHYESQLALKQEELLRIQSQINPHFLYNIFDFLYWTAVEKDDELLSNLLLDISDFYRNSLYERSDFVQLKQELKQVESYVRIQNARYDDKIKLEIVCDDHSLLEHEVMNFLLQPLVENALIHGVLEKENESGTIVIEVVEKREHMMIYIEDDGPGFPETILDHSFELGFGMKSIQKRLEIMYGGQAIFEYSNQSGARVAIGIPLR